MKTRDLFAEIMEGIGEMAAEREGKLTLRTFDLGSRAPLAPPVTPEEIRATRAKLNVSQAVFASALQLNKRTLERWEQGTAKANAQASLLIRMVARDPAMIERILEVAAQPTRGKAARPSKRRIARKHAERENGRLRAKA